MTEPAQNFGVRIPEDLKIELDKRRGKVPRSRVIVAALREYLKVPDPSEAIRNSAERKPS